MRLPAPRSAPRRSPADRAARNGGYTWDAPEGAGVDHLEGVMKRVLLILLVVAVVLAGVGYFAARHYLHSERVTAQVTARLEQLYGRPGDGAQVAGGVLGGTTLNGFKLYEPGGESKDAPWLQVESLTTDVSLWDI